MAYCPARSTKIAITIRLPMTHPLPSLPTDVPDPFTPPVTPGETGFSSTVKPEALLPAGSILGCTALIAGTTVGAGILALPTVTVPAGVIPSSALLLGVWFYALMAALLIAEANINRMRQGQPGTGLIAMAEQALGKAGARVAGAAYLFLHYAMLVAYIGQGGQGLQAVLARVGGMAIALPDWVGPVLFTLLLGGLVYAGNTRLVERFNTVFVVILLAAFLGLLGLGMTALEPARLLVQNWGALRPAIAIMFVALFFHNIIPVVTTQLQGDVAKVRWALSLGSAIPLLMFLTWNAVILGNAALDAATPATAATFDPVQLLRQGAGGTELGVLVSVFSELAIATSFIGFVYGLLDLFKDLWQLTPTDPVHRRTLFLLTLFPSLLIAMINPDLFVLALDYSGSFAISILSGLLPAIICWKQRRDNSINQRIPAMLPGGRWGLIGMMGVAIALIIQRLLEITYRYSSSI